MTAWTPVLEKLIRDFGECEERNTQDGCDPDMWLATSVLLIAFRSATRSQPLFKKICAEMEITADYSSGYTAALQKMIDLANANGSNAADKLKSKLAFTQDLNRLFPELGGIDRIKVAKRGEIRYPG